MNDFLEKESKSKFNWKAICVVFIVLFIFLIGYAFWHATKGEEKGKIKESNPEPKSIEELKTLLNEMKSEKSKSESELQSQINRRLKYFIVARLLLVILLGAVFLIFQFVFTNSFFKSNHILDNFRNFVTLIVLGFSIIAFIIKGNLNSFKEAIVNISIDWLFKQEKKLKQEVESYNYFIESLEKHILMLELQKSNR